jgi:hypothetical protein
VTNEELAKQFRDKVSEAAPLDYFDRFVDLAIYLNETIPQELGRLQLLDNLLSTMVLAYKNREEGNDRHSSAT